MSSLQSVSPPLQACVLCHSVAQVKVQPVASPSLDWVTGEPLMPGTGYQVVCLGCQLRGTWRPTEAAAIRTWNYHVTPDLAESGSAGV
jgi:hypothetical protein